MQQKDLKALLKTKRVFRDTTGHWRHGPTYLFIIDRTGYTLFHGAFPEKYELQTPTTTLRDAVTGELILPQIIEAATSSEEGGFVEYHFDNPDDDTDSAEILKVTYALERESTAVRGLSIRLKRWRTIARRSASGCMSTRRTAASPS